MRMKQKEHGRNTMLETTSTLDHLATLDPLVCLFVFAFLSVFMVSACERVFSSSGTQLQKLFLF